MTKRRRANPMTARKPGAPDPRRTTTDPARPAYWRRRGLIARSLMTQRLATATLDNLPTLRVALTQERALKTPDRRLVGKLIRRIYELTH